MTAKVAPMIEWTVELCKGPEETLGMRCQDIQDKGRVARVTQIMDGGLVSKFNERYPDDCIALNDFIVSVNGRDDCLSALQECGPKAKIVLNRKTDPKSPPASPSRS